MTVGKKIVVINVVELDGNELGLHMTPNTHTYRHIATRNHSSRIEGGRVGPETENSLASGKDVILRRSLDHRIESRKPDNLLRG